MTIQREEFLNWLITARVLPTTANPGPGGYFEAYESLVEECHDEIVSIHMTSKGSGAFQAALVAQSTIKEKDPEVHIEVIDTRNMALCQGWMAIEATHAALAGLGLEEVESKVKQMVPVMHMIQTADKLKYLYMGRRIGKATNLVGSLLNIKPLIGMADGEIVPLGVACGRGRAYQAIAEKVEETLGKSKARIAYMHAGAKQEVEKLRQILESKVDVVESFVGELSPAQAVHSGPGTAGFCFFPAEM